MLHHIKKTNLLTKLGVLTLGLSLTFMGCGGSGDGQEGEQKTAKLVYVNWAEGIAYTNLAQVVLEEKMGYDVSIQSAQVGPAYTDIAKGNSDAFMETWLPTLHKDYVEQYKEDIVDLGYVYEGTQSGLVVPQYMDINTISELNDVADELDGQITGIDAGAGVMKTTEEVIKKYDLDLELVSSSGPAMTASLQRAYKNEEPIVVTGWKPHWMFGRFDLKFLEQDQEKVWSEGNIHIMGRKNLEQDKPELAQFLKNMHFTDAELADLMVAVNESDEDIQVVVSQWMKDNPDVIESWIPES